MRRRPFLQPELGAARRRSDRRTRAAEQFAAAGYLRNNGKLVHPRKGGGGGYCGRRSSAAAVGSVCSGTTCVCADSGPRWRPSRRTAGLTASVAARRHGRNAVLLFGKGAGRGGGGGKTAQHSQGYQGILTPLCACVRVTITCSLNNT